MSYGVPSSTIKISQNSFTQPHINLLEILQKKATENDECYIKRLLPVLSISDDDDDIPGSFIRAMVDHDFFKDILLQLDNIDIDGSYNDFKLSTAVVCSGNYNKILLYTSIVYQKEGCLKYSFVRQLPRDLFLHLHEIDVEYHEILSKIAQSVKPIWDILDGHFPVASLDDCKKVAEVASQLSYDPIFNNVNPFLPLTGSIVKYLLSIHEKDYIDHLTVITSVIDKEWINPIWKVVEGKLKVNSLEDISKLLLVAAHLALSRYHSFKSNIAHCFDSMVCPMNYINLNIFVNFVYLVNKLDCLTWCDKMIFSPLFDKLNEEEIFSLTISEELAKRYIPLVQAPPIQTNFLAFLMRKKRADLVDGIEKKAAPAIAEWRRQDLHSVNLKLDRELLEWVNNFSPPKPLLPPLLDLQKEPVLKSPFNKNERKNDKLFLKNWVQQKSQFEIPIEYEYAQNVRISFQKHTIYRSYFYSNNWSPANWSKLEERISTIFNGRNFEVVQISRLQKKENNFWDNWDEKLNSKAADEYENLLHPLIAKMAVAILEKTQGSSVLEIAGGTGKLAKRILESSCQKLHYTLLELNDSEIGKAKGLLGNKVNVVKTDLVLEEDYYQNEEKSVPLFENSVDLAIGSGILTYSVLNNKEEAFNILMKVHRYMKVGGYFIITGFAESLLQATDFQKAGFTVHNNAIPGRPQHFYIIKKAPIIPIFESTCI